MITKKHHGIYINGSYYSRRRHTFMKLYPYSRSLSDHDCALFIKGTAQNQATRSSRNITFFEKYDLGSQILEGYMSEKCRTHVLSALCLLYFVSICSALFLKSDKFFRKLDNPCPGLWASDFSQFGDKKAGTSQSHDVGRYELDESGSDQNLEKTKQRIWQLVQRSE